MFSWLGNAPEELRLGTEALEGSGPDRVFPPERSVIDAAIVGTREKTSPGRTDRSTLSERDMLAQLRSRKDSGTDVYARKDGARGRQPIFAQGKPSQVYRALPLALFLSHE
jgi:hypothetical protein